jgi:hypothetical protein
MAASKPRATIASSVASGSIPPSTMASQSASCRRLSPSAWSGAASRAAECSASCHASSSCSIASSPRVWRVVDDIDAVIPTLRATSREPARLPLHMGDVA